MGPEPKKRSSMKICHFFCCCRDRYDEMIQHNQKKKHTHTTNPTHFKLNMIYTNSLFYHRHRHHNHYQNKHFEHHHNPVKRNANKILTKKRNHNQHRDNQSPIHIKINVKDTHTHTV